MPRLSQTLPKYRHHRASGQAVVTLNGRDFYLGPHNSKASKAAYDRLTGEWLQNGRQFQPTAGAPITVVELCVRFLKFAEGHYVKDGTPTGAVHGFKSCIKYLRLWYGRELASSFGPLALKNIRQRMVDDDLSRRYINDHIARIKRMFKWAVGEELIPAGVYQALTAVTGLLAGRSDARETPPVGPVDDSMVNATLPHLPEVVADMVRLQRLTGMRPHEVCIIRPCDVSRSEQPWIYRPSRHKTQHHGRERLVHLGPKARAILLPYLDRSPDAYCFQPQESELKRRAKVTAARKTPLSCGNRTGTNRRRRGKRRPGECYDSSAYRKAVARACEKAFPQPTPGDGSGDQTSAASAAQQIRWRRAHCWAPNRLRHTAATEIRNSFGLEAAQVVLGHSSANVSQIYAERDNSKAAAVAGAIG